MKANMTSGVTTLARWSARLRYEDIPAEVLDVARNCLIDTVGVALAGSQTSVAAKARDTAAAIYGAGQSAVFGSELTLSAPGAAFANGAAAHALDFDDNCYASFVHGSAVLVPAAIAISENLDGSGRDLLTALIAGAEVEYAVGKAMTANLYTKGWWTTGVLGPIGAAGVAARALALDAERTASAIGLAGAGTGGVKACFGTDGKPVLCGRATEAGVSAALLAAKGVTGPFALFEDSRGFAKLFNDGILDPAPFDELGRTWSLLDPGIDVKRIPVCLSAHAAVDAAMAIVDEQRLGLADIERIVCDVSPIVVANLAYPSPETPQQAQFSLPFAIACSLVHGDLRLEHLTSDVVNDVRIREAMERVEMTNSPLWSLDSALTRDHPEGASVTVFTRDGRRFDRLGRHARGMKQWPLTDEELAAKFRACAGLVPGLDVAAFLDRLQNVGCPSSARSLFERRPVRAPLRDAV